MSSSTAAVLAEQPRKHYLVIQILGVIVYGAGGILGTALLFASWATILAAPTAVFLLLEAKGYSLAHSLVGAACVAVLLIAGGTRAYKRMTKGPQNFESIHRIWQGVFESNPIAIYGWHGPRAIYSWLSFLLEVGRETMG